MAERKSLNKYIPTDVHPDKNPLTGGTKRHKKVRVMAPFSMRCDVCGEYIYKGKKFNAKKQFVKEENYLGIEIFRFHVRCPKCMAEITWKTDPKNLDYVAENGASRNYEPWRDESLAVDEMKAEREKIEEENPMKGLELRTLESKREMDILDALDEMKTRNAQMEKLDVDTVLQQMQETSHEQELQRMKEQEEEDDRLAKLAFKRPLEVIEEEEEVVRPMKRPTNNLLKKPTLNNPFIKKNDIVKPKTQSIVFEYDSD